MKKISSICAAVVMLTGCADHSDKIQATYVSPLQYQEYSCHQIRTEVTRLSHKVNEVAGIQDKTASNDSAAMGVGLILFWPALFFIDHTDQHVQLAELKGQYDALEEAAVRKNCDVAKEMAAAKKEAEANAAKKAAEEKANTSQYNNR